MLGDILILLLVLVLNGFFVASEMAIVSARKARLKQRAEEDNHPGAARALELANDSGKFFSSVQIGITVLGIFSGAFGGAKLSEPLAVLLQPYFPNDAEGIAFALVITLITYFTLIISELVPKRLAVANAEGIAAATAIPMHWFAKIGAPFVWLLGVSSEFVLRILPVRTEADASVTEEEVKTLIAEGTESGLFEKAEQQMLEGVLRLGDRSVRAVMTPRPDVTWLDLNMPVDEQIRRLIGLDFSRLPVGKGTLDDIAGIIYAKDMLNAYLRGVTPDVAGMLREPLTVHDAMPVLRLVDLFRSTRQHLAIVVDEHGSVEGIVTTTDILQAVTGNLPESLGDDATNIVTRSDGSMLVDAMMPVDEISAHLQLRGMKADDDDFHTLAGFVLKIAGGLPKTGEKFTWENYVFEVMDMDGRRIDKVLVTPPTKDKPED
jgi:putative hemolysin